MADANCERARDTIRQPTRLRIEIHERQKRESTIVVKILPTTAVIMPVDTSVPMRYMAFAVRHIIPIATCLLACGGPSAAPPHEPARRDGANPPATDSSTRDARVELARHLLAGEKPRPSQRLSTVLPTALGSKEAAVVDATSDLAPLLARVGLPELDHPAPNAATIRSSSHYVPTGKNHYALGEVDLGPTRVTILFSVDGKSPEPLLAAVYAHNQEVLPLVDADDVQVCIRYTRAGQAHDETVCRAR